MLRCNRTISIALSDDEYIVAIDGIVPVPLAPIITRVARERPSNSRDAWLAMPLNRADRRLRPWLLDLVQFQLRSVPSVV